MQAQDLKPSAITVVDSHHRPYQVPATSVQRHTGSVDNERFQDYGEHLMKNQIAALTFLLIVGISSSLQVAHADTLVAQDGAERSLQSVAQDGADRNLDSVAQDGADRALNTAV